MTDIPSESSPPSNTGRWTVFAMFGFAVTMIILLFAYWEFYTAPFRPLQYAIAERYPGSGPRVVGGKHKSHHEENPMVLRIIIYVQDDEFNPEEDEEAREERALELAQLAFQYQDISKYDKLQIVLQQRVPESETRLWDITESIDAWRQKLSDQDSTEESNSNG